MKNINYEVLQEQDGYKIVSFDSKFYNKLNNILKKQSKKFYKLLNPVNKIKSQFTLIPTLYNHENVKSALIIENLINEDSLLGFVLDENMEDSFFYKLSMSLQNTKNNFCPMQIDGINLIFCEDEVIEVENLKTFVNDEIIKDKTRKILKNKKFDILNLNKNEQAHIQEKIKQIILDMIENDISISENKILLTQVNLSKVIIDKKRLKDYQKLLEMFNLEYMLINDTIYFSSKNFSIFQDLTEKFVFNNISASKFIPNFEKDYKIPQKENILFKYKDIETVIKEKTKNKTNKSTEFYKYFVR